MSTAIRKFEIVTDEQGYAMALAVDGWFLIHFQRGTVRNEENAQKLLAVLNAAVVAESLRGAFAAVIALREALQDIMPTAANGGKGES